MSYTLYLATRILTTTNYTIALHFVLLDKFQSYRLRSFYLIMRKHTRRIQLTTLKGESYFQYFVVYILYRIVISHNHEFLIITKKSKIKYIQFNNIFGTTNLIVYYLEFDSTYICVEDGTANKYNMINISFITNVYFVNIVCEAYKRKIQREIMKHLKTSLACDASAYIYRLRL